MAYPRGKEVSIEISNKDLILKMRLRRQLKVEELRLRALAPESFYDSEQAAQDLRDFHESAFQVLCRP